MNNGMRQEFRFEVNSFDKFKDKHGSCVLLPYC